MMAPGAADLHAHKHNNVLNQCRLSSFLWRLELCDMSGIGRYFFINTVFRQTARPFTPRAKLMSSFNLPLQMHSIAFGGVQGIVCLDSFQPCILGWMFDFVVNCESRNSWCCQIWSKTAQHFLITVDAHLWYVAYVSIFNLIPNYYSTVFWNVIKMFDEHQHMPFEKAWYPLMSWELLLAAFWLFKIHLGCFLSKLFW